MYHSRYGTHWKFWKSGVFPPRPEVLPGVLGRVVEVRRVAGYQRLLVRERSQEPAQLPEELHRAVEPVVVGAGLVAPAVPAPEAVRPVGEEVQLGRDPPLAQLAVDLRRGERRIRVGAAVEHAHGGGLLVELEDGVELRALAATRVRDPKPVVERVADRASDRPVEVAGNVVDLVDLFVGGRQCARREERRKVGAGGHRDRADPIGVKPALHRLRADEPHRALPVLPRALVEREALRARRAVDEVHALEAGRGELLPPHVHKPDVAAVFVGAARDQDHAAAVRLLGRGKPVDVGCGIVPFLVCHFGDLMRLGVGHLARRPEVLALGGRGKRREKERYENSLHSIPPPPNGNCGRQGRSARPASSGTARRSR